MDKNAIAKRLAALGHQEAACTRQLIRIQAERCRLLSDAIPDAGLDDDTVIAASAPKDGGGR